MAGLAARCPDCGTELPSDAAIEGLCPQCLLSLALRDSGPDLDELETLDGPSPGRILGGRYQMRELLGRGGMGEVWRAFDLKLRVDVALKAIRPERAESARAGELLRQEVRSAREVVSPNVCRIFDLVVEEGRELVSMEYIDGTTLAETLRTRGPLQLQEAREIASQFLSGLEAIHAAGLVHRDFKPENVMITRAGRVVVMDFGLAKGRAEVGTGTISGTPAYMSPEQARGSAVDARADVFAAGVVLAEMLSVGGEGLRARQALWHAVRETPPQVPEGPWAPVLRQALDPQAERRYASARALARALEEVTLRLPGFEEKRPYPGLASFTQEDAEYFFGREVEVEAIWKKLKRPRLLALIGPSGAGKSSFLRAGLLPTLPNSWAAVVSTPGSRPFQALARSLVPAFSGDTRATEALLRFEEEDTAVSLCQRWRQRHEQALVVVDQFEELFTLNAPEVREAFARLLERLVLEADVHVLLSMRDDFLAHCHAHEALAPILNDLTLLGPLSGSGLRRALVQPAVACGYRFEDEALVEEMVQEVGLERGVLPLLAFAASRLWEKRDRERGLLTREAYQDVGRVAGALAQHAEATLESIGTQRTPLVRELFRNLVTAQGTRAAREREELLSIFETSPKVAPQPEAASTPAPLATEAPGWSRKEAAEVLDALIDARLLTEYERPGDEEGKSHPQVEIIHESLLVAWPRLVRWQTQDADGAQLRDQLRQAVQVWQDRGRPEDLLWSGSAYRDFALWRERYPGGLTATEEAFAEAATKLAGRRRRRRRIAVAAILTTAVAVAGVTAGLWRRSEVARQHAQAEALRAEAGKLLALGQTYLDADPTAALAYAKGSLDLFDTPEARTFALEVLWRGPVARILPVDRSAKELRLPEDPSGIDNIKLSPDGRWLASRSVSQRILLFSRETGAPRALSDPPETDVSVLGFGPDGDVLVTGGPGQSVRLWSLPDLRERRTVALGGRGSWAVVSGGVLSIRTETASQQTVLQELKLPDGEPKAIATVPPDNLWDVNPTHTWLVHGRGRTVVLRSLDATHRERILGELRDEVQEISFSPTGDRVATLDHSGEIRIWSPAGSAVGPIRVLQGPKYALSWLMFDPRGHRLTNVGPNNAFYVWDLDDPPDAEAVVLGRPGPGYMARGTFDGRGRWLATSWMQTTIEFWPLASPRRRALRGFAMTIATMGFTPDGRWLATCSQSEPARLWPLDPTVGSAHNLVPEEPCMLIRMHPQDSQVLVGAVGGKVLLVPTEGGRRRQLLDRRERPNSTKIAFDRQGRRAVAVRTSEGLLRTWDLPSGRERVYSLPHLPDADWSVTDFAFAPDGRLYVSGQTGMGVRRLELPAETEGTVSSETLFAAGSTRLDLSRDGRLLLVLASQSRETRNQLYEELRLFDLAENTSRGITTHGSRLGAAVLSPSGRVIVTGDVEGAVRVGPASGEEPHLLFGHRGPVASLAVSPDERWIASAGDDAIYLWPMPDLTKPPFHTLPHAELMARLDALTNLRVVRDASSSTGWKLDIGPFNGWKDVPTW